MRRKLNLRMLVFVGAITFVLLLACNAFADAHARPSADEVRKAVEQLNSNRPEEVVAAAEVICRSDDAAAWGALRSVLADPEKLGRLEVRTHEPEIEGSTYEKMHAHLAAVLRAVAQGPSSRAAGTLMWLVEQGPYANTYRTDNKEERSWRASLAYDAFRHVRSPSKELIEFFAEKLASKTFHNALKPSVMETLAAYGTPASIKLFEEYLWRDGARPIMLIRHRDNYECVRLLLSLYRGATNAKYAHGMLRQLLFDESYQLGRREPFALPRIEPKEEDIEKLTGLLRGFLKDHGSIPLTEQEQARIQALIAAPAWALLVTDRMEGWEFVSADRQPTVKIGPAAGRRLVLRLPYQVDTAPPGQGAQQSGQGQPTSGGQQVARYDHAQIVVFDAGANLPADAAGKITWTEWEGERYAAMTVDMGAGHGLRWLARMPLFWQDHLRQKLKLAGGDDRLAILVKALEDEGRNTANVAAGLLAGYGDAAVPHLEKVLAKYAPREGEPGAAFGAAVKALGLIHTDASTRLLRGLYADAATRTMAAYGLTRQPFRAAAADDYVDMLRRDIRVTEAAQACAELGLAGAVGPLRKICDKPPTAYAYVTCFRAMRKIQKRPIPKQLDEAAEAIRTAARADTPASAEAIAKAKAVLTSATDREAAAFVAACLATEGLKGSSDVNDRINGAGWEVLSSLPRDEAIGAIKPLLPHQPAPTRQEARRRFPGID